MFYNFRQFDFFINNVNFERKSTFKIFYLNLWFPLYFIPPVNWYHSLGFLQKVNPNSNILDFQIFRTRKQRGLMNCNRKFWISTNDDFKSLSVKCTYMGKFIYFSVQIVSARENKSKYLKSPVMSRFAFPWAVSKFPKYLKINEHTCIILSTSVSTNTRAYLATKRAHRSRPNRTKFGRLYLMNVEV